VAVPAKARCCRIRFQGSFHIDVPTYHLDPAQDARALATEANRWEDSDPKALYLWFRNSFDEGIRGKVRRQIRYLKCWVALTFRDERTRPSSTLLMVLVSDALSALAAGDMIADDETFGFVVDTILGRLESDRSVANPVDVTENLFGRLRDQEIDDFIRALRRLKTIADEALESHSELAAATKWSEAFEHFFPMPEIDNLQKALAESGRNLPARLAIPEVHVQATSRQNSAFKWNGVNQIGPIPKDCSIDFAIVNQRVFPPDAQVHWMVRNEGDEAEYTNDLGHQAGTGWRATERSAYTGTHYMDCVVWSRNAIIGMRRIPVRIDGTFVPRRNPPARQRPPWARGRR